jgi:uncharacterized membrane protein HdeD (DUF308 family)
VAAKYILAALAAAFLLAAAVRLLAAGGRRHPQGRSWLLIGVIFGIVSAWLFYQA